jgi:hypothetical protein
MVSRASCRCLLNLRPRRHAAVVAVDFLSRAARRWKFIRCNNVHPPLPQQERQVANAGADLDEGAESDQCGEGACVERCKGVEVARPRARALSEDLNTILLLRAALGLGRWGGAARGTYVQLLAGCCADGNFWMEAANRNVSVDPGWSPQGSSLMWGAHQQHRDAAAHAARAAAARDHIMSTVYGQSMYIIIHNHIDKEIYRERLQCRLIIIYTSAVHESGCDAIHVT